MIGIVTICTHSQNFVENSRTAQTTRMRACFLVSSPLRERTFRAAADAGRRALLALLQVLPAVEHELLRAQQGLARNLHRLHALERCANDVTTRVKAPETPPCI